ncbi:hypothetical protein [Candidatus Deianiraea vastatrix]|uniref:Uncharacterized protein n=1 Tax=Candidatus Deianiraea vastatrix TaxID=2163644 RepID=A0A5B8XD16_9RICK|nr:hypothetical protein [Candidatus Deianiraea vastatrix]QED22916.1 hypothetical protein Deia_00104 [Candidatus Deianiraea vastatrix]
MNASIVSIAKAKVYLVCLSIIEKTDYSMGFDELFSNIEKIVLVNDRNILEFFSSRDRASFVSIVLRNCKSSQDLQNVDIARKIRSDALLNICDKHILNDAKKNIVANIDKIKNKIIENINIIGLHNGISEKEKRIFLEIVFDDICYCLASKFQNFIKENNDVNNAKCKILFDNFTLHISSNTEKAFQKVFNFDIKNFNDNALNIANSIFNETVLSIERINSELSAVSKNSIRQRENLLNIRENEIEKKESEVDEMFKKNLEFSIELQKRASEIDAKMDKMELDKLEIKEYIKKINEIAKKVINLTDNFI